MAARVFLCVVLVHWWTVQQAHALVCDWAYKPCRDQSECFSTQQECDGVKDCNDGSDEDNCPGCLPDQFQCVKGRKCIQLTQVCDRQPHCPGGLDEVDCPSEFCFHRCSDGNRCLPASMLCDGEADCLDESDEKGCDLGKRPAVPVAPPAVPVAPPAVPVAPPAVPVAPPAVHTAPPPEPLEPLLCAHGTVQCRNQVQCVPYNHVCDGYSDCRDGTDEDDCPSSCDPDQFQCAHGRKCIPKTQVCDGQHQCQDQSDEVNCRQQVDGCSHYCDENQHCIPESFLCDGERDCQDGTDEDQCEAKSCGVTEFQCLSGECVKSSMHCDGHPDCSDQSDEEGCGHAVACPTKLRCERSKECLLPQWLCDGQQDCRDGGDEKNCSVAQLDCADFQWSCQSRTQCLSARWKCDGTVDCQDASDESECGPRSCGPHLMRCSSQECLDVSLMCNGVRNCVDGSDEGPGCTTTCSEADQARCSQTCQSTPQGPRCACMIGFRLREDGTTCDDVDECASATACGQLCINSVGSYHCACQQGFVMEQGGKHCKVSGEPYLLISVQTDLLLQHLRSRSLEVLPSLAQKAILSVDYDWKEQKVYWVTVEADGIRWSTLDQKTTGTLIRGIRADSVAVDWLGRNLYWIDGERSQIVAIPLSMSSNYSIILDEDLDQPRSLALMPQKGLMFWTEIGNIVRIERAGMDGSDRRVLVNSSLGWPGTLTVDMVSNRIYWTDERLQAIGSATLDGSDLQILQIKETANPFSVAVFNEKLYWSDTERRVVYSADKVSGKNKQVLLKRLRQPFAVKIIHPVLQMGPEGLCQQKACSHICVLAPGPVAVCRCPDGLFVVEDGRSCSSQKGDAFLLMLSPSTLTKISLQSLHVEAGQEGRPEQLVLQVPSTDKTAIMDYSVKDHTFLMTDDGRSSLNSFRLRDFDLVPQGRIFGLQNDSICAIALDWVTRNVYWSSENQPGLQVTSIPTEHTAVLMNVGLRRLESLTLHPPTGGLCFSNVDQLGGSTVECSSMDGSQRRVVCRDVVHATSLVFSTDGKMVYWADTGLESICSVHVDGSGFRKVNIKGVSAVALSEDTLLWMTGDKRQLWFRDEQQQQNRMWVQVEHQVVALKAISRSTHFGWSQCAGDNGGCQQLCLATSGGRSCRCDHKYTPLNATHCQPKVRCPEGSRPCLDHLTCQPASKFCDGHMDCADGSDEICVDVKTNSGVPAPPAATAVALTTQSKGSGANTTLEIVSQLDVQDANRFFQKFQGPVMYAAVAGCAGLLLLIVVVVVVVLKKRNSDRGASSAVATETSMMKMQYRSETEETKCQSDVGGQVEVLQLNTTTS